MIILLVDVMTEADEVRIILKSHHSFAVNLGQGEEIFQNVRDAVTKARVEIIEDHMWVGLTHWIDLVFEVMSQHDVR